MKGAYGAGGAQITDQRSMIIFEVAIRNGEIPVPIPNTTVKTDTAESTLLETAREDRWLPHQKGNYTKRCFTYISKNLYLENRISKDPRILNTQEY